MALLEFTSPNHQNIQSTGSAISVASEEYLIGPVMVAQATPIITDTPATGAPAADAPAPAAGPAAGHKHD